MRFTWDPHKSDENFRQRGFDFAFATLIFEGPTLEREDQRRDYGERRIVATGMAGGMSITVVYTDRKPGSPEHERRIISTRRSTRKERRLHEEAARKET